MQGSSAGARTRCRSNDPPRAPLPARGCQPASCAGSDALRRGASQLSRHEQPDSARLCGAPRGAARPCNSSDELAAVPLRALLSSPHSASWAAKTGC